MKSSTSSPRALLATLGLSMAACGGTASEGSSASSTAGGESTAGPAGMAITAAFEAETFTAADAEIPRMHLALVLADETGGTQRVALADGMNCGESAPAEGTLLSIRCYFAGTGDAYHLVRDGADLVLLHEDLAEELETTERRPVRRFRLASGATVTPRT